MTSIQEISHAVRPWTLTVLRVAVGLIMAAHGWTKLTDYGGWVSNLDSMGVPFADVAAPLAVTAELVGGLALAIGALTPLAAAGVLVTMIVAIVSVHLPNGLFAKDGGFEYPLVMAAASLFFLTRGAGPISADQVIFGRRQADDERLTATGATAATS